MTTAVKERRAKVVPPEPTRKDIVLPELERLRQANPSGILLAEDVVSSAQADDSPLHKYFVWDDTEAAKQYRLWQARQLITAMVTILPNTKKSVVAYVSLRDDRQYPQGGYRAVVDVMSDTELRDQLLAEALADLRTWQRKYNHLKALIPVFEAAERVRRRITKK